jgi:hypothetical protein
MSAGVFCGRPISARNPLPRGGSTPGRERSFRLNAVVSAVALRTLARDEDQERRSRLPLLDGKGESAAPAAMRRSPPSWTRSGSGKTDAVDLA